MDDRTGLRTVTLSRAEVLRLYEPKMMREKREAETLARMADILDPVAFWCRFCRVTLEPRPSGVPVFRLAPLPRPGASWSGYLDALAQTGAGWML